MPEKRKNKTETTMITKRKKTPIQKAAKGLKRGWQAKVGKILAIKGIAMDKYKIYRIVNGLNTDVDEVLLVAEAVAELKSSIEKKGKKISKTVTK